MTAPDANAASTPDTNAASILVVCTGNICRSPAAERVLAARLGPNVGVSSAGTGALVGEPISPPMDRLVASVGGDATGFHARQVDPADIARYDVVLGLTREHRSWLVTQSPVSLRRTFTLRELARLGEHVDPSELPAHGSPSQRLRALVPLALRLRAKHRVPAELDDVADPYRRGDAAYAAAFAEIDDATARLTAVLLPSD